MPPKKIKITKLGKKNKPVTKKKLAAARKKIKRLNPHDAMMAKIIAIVPAVKDVEGEEAKSWSLLADKILLAKRMKTSVFVVTMNPKMIEYREVLQKAFPCAIQSPTEARFGMDSIEKF